MPWVLALYLFLGLMNGFVHVGADASEMYKEPRFGLLLGVLFAVLVWPVNVWMHRREWPGWGDW